MAVSENTKESLEFKRRELEKEDKQEHHVSVIKEKILAVSKMRKVFRVIREENDNIVKLKALSPSGRLPAGILSKGSKAIAEALSSFEKARNADLENMQLPGPGKRKKSVYNEGAMNVARRSLKREKHSGVVFISKK